MSFLCCVHSDSLARMDSCGWEKGRGDRGGTSEGVGEGCNVVGDDVKRAHERRVTEKIRNGQLVKRPNAKS